MKNRSREEIDAILQTFPDVFEDLTGHSLTAESLKEVIIEVLKVKERDIIKQRFFDFSPRDLRTIMQKLNEPTIPEQSEDIMTQALKVASKVSKKNKK